MKNLFLKAITFSPKKNLPLIVLILFGILFFSMGILNHYFFRTYTHDYGNYNFALWDYSHFRISPLTTFRGTFLQDHFSFLLMYFVPIYWLINWITQTYTLIIIQYSLVLAAAWYTFKIIKLKTNNLWLGTGVIIYYFTLLGRYTTFTADVNLAVMSACFIPVFIYYFEIRRYLVSMILLILALFSRENIPIWFIFIFIVLIIQHRKDKEAIGYSLAGIAISIIYFILLFKVFIPSVETPGIKFALFNYSALGATPGEAFSFIISHPVQAVKMFFINHLNDPAYNGIKGEFYLVYLVSGGFILLLRPQYLIWFIPVVAQKVLNDNAFRWGIGTYYSIEFITLLPLSVFLILSSLKSRSLQNVLTIIACIATIVVTIHELDQTNNKTPWAFEPSKTIFYDSRFITPPFNVEKVNQLLKKIPPTAKLSASNNLLPHLSQRKYIYFFPDVKDAEYIVFSIYDDHYMYSHEVNELNRNNYLSDPNWKVIASEHPVYLLKLSNSGNDLQSGNRRNQIDTLFCDYEKIDKETGTVLFSNNQTAEMPDYLTTEKSHSASHSIKLTAEKPFNTSHKVNDVEKIAYLQLSCWYYSKDDKAGIVATSGKDFYIGSNTFVLQEPSGWKKVELNFLVPPGINVNNFTIYLWNSGTEPAYFDDLQIIKKYKQ